MMFQSLKKLLITVSISLIAFPVFGESIRSYDISLKVDPVSFRAAGSEEILFIPAADTEEMKFHLFWNGYDSGALFRMNAPGNLLGELPESALSSIKIREVSVNGLKISGDAGADPTVWVLRYHFRKGHAYKVKVDFDLKIPDQRLFRFGYDSKDGVYWLSQWFPKAGVLDNDGTWSCEPFDFYREFNSEYSNYTISIDLPDGYEVISNLPGRGDLFSGSRISDVVLGISEKFHVYTRQHGDTLIRLCSYMELPPDTSEHILDRSARNLDYMEERVGDYPYKLFTVADLDSIGIQGEGMEYPMLINVSSQRGHLNTVLDHEMVHQWFYGIIGFDETHEGWLDEGFTSYYEIRLDEDSPPRDVMGVIYTPFDIKYVTAMHSWDKTGDIFVAPGDDDVAPQTKLLSYYYKFPVIIRMMESRVGKEYIDEIFAEMYKRYAFSHPGTKEITDLFDEMLPSEDYRDMMTMISGKGDTSFSLKRTGQGYVLSTGEDRQAPVALRLVTGDNVSSGSHSPGEYQAEELVSLMSSELDETPGDNFIARGKNHIPAMVYLIFLFFTWLIMKKWKKRKILSEIFWNLVIFAPLYFYILFLSSGLDHFDRVTAGFSPVVMVVSRAVANPPMLLLVFVFLALVAKITLRSIALYRTDDTPFSFFHIFFIDLMNALLIPLLLVLMVSVRTSSILLIFAFVFMISLAEPFKMTILSPGKKNLPMKEVMPLSFVITLVYVAVMMIFLISAVPFIIFSVYFFITTAVIASAAEYLHRISYINMYRYLERKKSGE